LTATNALPSAKSFCGGSGLVFIMAGRGGAISTPLPIHGDLKWKLSCGAHRSNLTGTELSNDQKIIELKI